MKIAITTGGYDPIHSGHIEYMKAAKDMADYLIVGINSDEWLLDKKGKAFMPESERVEIVRNLKMVDEVRVVPFAEDRSCCSLIEDIKRDYPNDEIVFCNGGDRTSDNIPEMKVDGVTFEFGVGGTDKKNSSSWILRNALSHDAEERQWGRFYNFFLDKDIKVKELIVEPGKSLSYQRHNYRNEFWFVSKGECWFKTQSGQIHLNKHDQYTIPVGSWHQLINVFEKPCHIIEIQYGSKTDEEDIERKDPKV